MVLATFIVSFLAVLIVGIASVTRSRGSRSDYYVASRDVSPALVGLSAVATNNSGYMFIGVIGFTYATGLAAVWLMAGWIIGDFVASLFIHRRIRIQTELRHEVTFGGMLSRWDGADFRILRRVAAVLTIIFLGAYAAAQLSAGGKALQGVFGWNPDVGAVLVAVVVALYCFAGGIRASIWTDVLQSGIMLVAMAMLLSAGVAAVGGIDSAISQMAEIPGYLNWFPDDLIVPGGTGAILFVAGWFFAGLSVIGQPHIMIRFMALDNPDHLMEARWYYYSFFAVFYAMATGVGMLARLLLPELAGIDAELALPTMAHSLLPPMFVGVVLAGIFAATMSTADSLILSCSAAITYDLTPRSLEKTWEVKVATLAVTALALVIAMANLESVFSLVILAWSALASAFAPLLIVYAAGRGVTERTALAMVLVGPLAALLWRELGWHNSVYEGFPGILAGLAVYAIGAALTRRRPTAEASSEPNSPVN